MTLYATIEEAIVDLIKDNGREILNNTCRLIAMLSDYAPNLSEAQHIIRLFARADGFVSLVREIEANKSSASVLSMICLKAVQATKNGMK